MPKKTKKQPLVLDSSSLVGTLEKVRNQTHDVIDRYDVGQILMHVYLTWLQAESQSTKMTPAEFVDYLLAKVYGLPDGVALPDEARSSLPWEQHVSLQKVADGVAGIVRSAVLNGNWAEAMATIEVISESTERDIAALTESLLEAAGYGAAARWAEENDE